MTLIQRVCDINEDGDRRTTISVKIEKFRHREGELSLRKPVIQLRIVARFLNYIGP